MRNPFSVVVFDEVEKASYKVHELLLQILEEGRLTDGKGNTVPFSETVIIMTSNVGVREVDAINNTIGFGDVSKVTDDKRSTTISKAIKKKFKPEFINRIDSIVYFKSLSKKDLSTYLLSNLSINSSKLTSATSFTTNSLLLKNLLFLTLPEKIISFPIKSSL